jgi:leucine dehydrogenase
MQSLIKEWDGESVVVSYHRPTDTWVFVAIHDTTLGPAMGGCRLRVYDAPRDGLRDAMRLAAGMTAKWAVAGFEFGGGKSVLAPPRPLQGADRVSVLEHFGDLLESLGGSYMTGEDLGTTPEDMAIIGRRSQWVHGVDGKGDRAVDPGPYTALGVFVGMRAFVRQVLGGELEGRTVLIQGAGDVGRPLAHRLHEAGARLIVSDVDASRAEGVAKEVDGRTVSPEAAYETECDVFAPCAVGAVLGTETIPRLRCRIVAGSANNQLATDDDAEGLHQRGIWYAPDYVVNAGGAIALPMLGQGRPKAAIDARIRNIERTMEEILAEAVERNESPLHSAGRRVQRVLETARGRSKAVGSRQ